MGLFDLLFGCGRGQSVKQLEDKVWLTPQARDAGMMRQLSQISRSAAVLLVGHFPDTLATLQAVADSCDGTVPLRVVLANDLSDDAARQLSISSDAVVDLLVGERHPLLSRDQAITRFAEQLGCQARVSYHVTLKDPLLQKFAGDWVEALLQRLGLQEDDAIQSAMISRRIQAAQKMIEERVPTDHDAASAAEWFARNLGEP